MSTPAFEKHYRVAELAALWGFSDATIIKQFSDEPGVLRLGQSVGRRKYVTLSIPESVALRVHERLGYQSFQPSFPAKRPLKVILLRDLNRGMPKQPTNILKRNTTEKRSHGESIAESMRPTICNAAMVANGLHTHIDLTG